MSDSLFALAAAFGLALLAGSFFWPERGLYPRWQRMRRQNGRVLREDALKHAQKLSLRGQKVTSQSLAGALSVSRDRANQLIAELEANQLLARDGMELSLTPSGQEAALHIIRAHRLWEQFLAERTGFDEAEWHVLAENAEHALSAQQADELARQLGHPTHDPHGDPIPTRQGQLVGHGGQPLAGLAAGQVARVVHLSDEPEEVAAQLRAEGLYPGMLLRVIDTSPTRLKFWAGENEHILAPVVAAHIEVLPMAQAVPEEEGAHLNDLKPGERAEVVRISARCRGPERRRFMDLGILPGTVIEVEFSSAGGDPLAYRIRDALIALRNEQANLIRVRKIEKVQA